MAHAHAFNINPVDQFASLNAAIRRPKEIACFSYDEEHQFRPDDSSLRYYYPPTLPADLSKGFDTFRQLNDTKDEHLDGLLDAIITFEQSRKAKLETDIVTWRGMMTKIMITPFSHLDSWEMNATRFQDTIYIEENHSKKLSSRDEQFMGGARPGAMSQDLMSYWGYKFETLSLLPDQWCNVPREYIDGREDMIVSNYAQYCSIVRTGFGKTKMVIGGEVDAVLDVKPADTSQPINWVELKTSAEITNERGHIKFQRKLLKFWAQSFLLGVPKIIVGFRSPQGLLQRLEEIDTQGIPEKVMRQGKKLWDGQICINFTASFLDWLKTIITEDGVWRIQKREKAPVLEIIKIEESGTGDIISPSFLDWRLKGLGEMLESERQSALKADESTRDSTLQPP